MNRNFPNIEPATEGGGAEPTYEFWPPNGRQPKVMQFMITTSGLNSYAHTFLMPSGRMFVQANISSSECVSRSLSTFLKIVVCSSMGLR